MPEEVSSSRCCASSAELAASSSSSSSSVLPARRRRHGSQLRPRIADSSHERALGFVARGSGVPGRRVPERGGAAAQAVVRPARTKVDDEDPKAQRRPRPEALAVFSTPTPKADSGVVVDDGAVDG
eukprot:CAMPEP_0177186496 /NCGR_PEP_ID=MMETSP0367-20130122/18677_1 /TAXON_ID=447022 ORGANISM="Scrippsiella hangoei-like, Strain SHHI-4" /NCGR_SAMPLE_ID=MMETSP0367 /ASSEMBLY_ACC=CAM_ASM_000362 /LENGTH=125 /DNA_ID=CAMNT_0018633793 /DNA_START=463 /DNA_END=837 /DNA_ORIENTATION=-